MHRIDLNIMNWSWKVDKLPGNEEMYPSVNSEKYELKKNDEFDDSVQVSSCNFMILFIFLGLLAVIWRKQTCLDPWNPRIEFQRGHVCA